MRETLILDYLARQAGGATTADIAAALGLHRSNVSAILNRLCTNGRVQKQPSRPVLYQLAGTAPTIPPAPVPPPPEGQADVFSGLVGTQRSLKACVQKAKAAILYPPNGLNTLLVGETGVGKTMFAGLMHRFAIQNDRLPENAPFVSFNCADYAANPQLLMAHLFGSVKGAFTGADADRPGLVSMAANGILFLDEIHRLSPEGQEMLFYLMDHRMYKPLGAVDFITGQQVMIICATTENPEATLLPTLLRRIPMTMQIPALSQRTLEERYELIIQFFGDESVKIQREIALTKSAMQHLLLYDCPGNIGQLKNDIRLGCANGFVAGMNSGAHRLLIDLSEFSDNVRQGILYYRARQQELEGLLGESVRFVFSGGQVTREFEGESPDTATDLCRSVEKRVEHYQQRGLSDAEIGELIGPEMDVLYSRYLGRVATFSEAEFQALVDRRILLYAEDFMDSTGRALDYRYSTAVFRGLALYTAQMLLRAQDGRHVRNYRLLEAKNQHPQEYDLCTQFAALLEQIYHVRISLDEVAYLTHFICPPSLSVGLRPVVFILMHGESSAQSMANVVKRLIGASNIYAYDMSLALPAKEAYLQVKQVLDGVDLSQGVLMLVDMGSLKVFGEMLSGEWGVPVRVLDMVSTALALECSRLTLSCGHVDEVYCQVKESLAQLGGTVSEVANDGTESFAAPDARAVILTLCMTGEGSALKLKKLVEDKLSLTEESPIQVMACAIYSREEISERINRISKTNEIICVVGTQDPGMYSIPFIPIAELVFDKDYSRLRNYATLHSTRTQGTLPSRYTKELYEELFACLEEEIPGIPIQPLKQRMPALMENFFTLGYTKDWEQHVGLIFHLACLLDKVVNGQPTRDYDDIAGFVAQYGQPFGALRGFITPLEGDYGVALRQDDLIYLLKIILRL